jgi:hypothetical protein
MVVEVQMSVWETAALICLSHFMERCSLVVRDYLKISIFGYKHMNIPIVKYLYNYQPKMYRLNEKNGFLQVKCKGVTLIDVAPLGSHLVEPDRVDNGLGGRVEVRIFVHDDRTLA